MTPLTIDLFVSAHDAEAAEYRIRAGLQEAHRAFLGNHVYPHLGGLIALRRELTALLDSAEHVRGARPGPITGVDLTEGTVLREAAPADAGAPLLALELARWALPMVERVIDEGHTLYDFVEAHAELEAVGLVPPYQREGFLLVPEPARGWLALRYAVGVLTGAGGPYRMLRTVPVDVDAAVDAGAAEWRAVFLAACPELPAPAIYRVATDVDFPVEETVLPVAKRKLLRLVTTPGLA